MEAIEERQKGRLILEQVKSLRLGVDGGVRLRKSVLREVAGERCKELPIALIERRVVRDEYGLVKLGAASQHRGDKRDAEAASLIPRKVGEARGFVVFVLGQEGICNLTYRHE